MYFPRKLELTSAQPDKAAIFKAMELHHTERMKSLYAQAIVSEIIEFPLRQMIHALVTAIAEMFEHQN
ncbi:hypothetical protein [uncultured Nostoc sp.]|uniref:hypothetical protein n=1 Tax=uncultured Nostoc sp. TaxID=340711 RepID=UPI00262C7E4D|nr:hypothetical protein [uncultured Nostoc sp.]